MNKNTNIELIKTNSHQATNQAAHKSGGTEGPSGISAVLLFKTSSLVDLSTLKKQTQHY